MNKNVMKMKQFVWYLVWHWTSTGTGNKLISYLYFHTLLSGVPVWLYVKILLARQTQKNGQAKDSNDKNSNE